MARLKRGRRTRRLVLDIGTSAIRLAELSPTKEGYQLSRYYQREFNIDPAMDDEDKAERRKEVLQQLLKETKVRNRRTIMAVPGQSVFTRNRPLPPVPEYKVTQIVRYEIQQQIPFSLDQIALDYQVLGRTEAGGYDVMMAAIKVDVVEKQLDILRKVKRAIDIVDVAPIAAYNWLKHTGEFGDDGQCVALVDLGATTTDIVIQKDNQFRFTRSLHVGGNDVTSAIASSFNMSFSEAEKLKREKGFAPTGDPKRDGKGGEVIGRVLGRLVAEINRSFAYFRSQPGGGPIQRVIVTGGGACLRNTIPYLQRSLGMEIRIAQPLAGLAISPKANEASEHPEQACVVLGLALRCCQNVPIQINLIPPRIRELARRKEQIFYWVLSLATMYLILASIIPVTAQKNEEVTASIKRLSSILATYDASLVSDPTKMSDFENDLEFVTKDIEGFRQDVNQLDNLRGYSNFWLPYLQAINDSLPITRGVGISAIETIVLGGAGNTGVAAWRTQAGEAAPEIAPEATAPAAAAPTPPRAGLAGGFSALAASGSVPGGARPGGGASDPVWGFGGITPHELTEPNGLSIVGYASDDDKVKEFVDNLRASNTFVDVFYDKAFLAAVSDAELSTAKTTSPVGNKSAAATGAQGSAGSGEGEIGFGNMANMANLAGTSGPSTGGDVGTGKDVFQFHIDVQIVGKPIKRETD